MKDDLKDFFLNRLSFQKMKITRRSGTGITEESEFCHGCYGIILKKRKNITYTPSKALPSQSKSIAPENISVPDTSNEENDAKGTDNCVVCGKGHPKKGGGKLVGMTEVDREMVDDVKRYYSSKVAEDIRISFGNYISRSAEESF